MLAHLAYTVFILILASALGVVGINFIVSGFKTMRGSREAYDMNRRMSHPPRKAIFGTTKIDVIDGEPRVEHGIAFRYDSKSETSEVIVQSKISSESIFETLK